jgi:hypothetical protein
MSNRLIVCGGKQREDTGTRGEVKVLALRRKEAEGRVVQYQRKRRGGGHG